MLINHEAANRLAEGMELYPNELAFARAATPRLFAAAPQPAPGRSTLPHAVAGRRAHRVLIMELYQVPADGTGHDALLLGAGGALGPRLVGAAPSEPHDKVVFVSDLGVDSGSMNLAPKQLRPATLADLDALPPTWRGEILDGELYAFPRPGAPHALIETAVGADLNGPFHRGRGGPGGWWILVEPGIQLPRAPEVAPDLAGWRRERLARLPRTGPIEIVPDWVCEILSASTRSYDMLVKRQFYAAAGVGYLWYIDPDARTLTVSRLEGGRWLELGVFGGDQVVRAEPFEAADIALGPWWEAVDPTEAPA